MWIIRDHRTHWRRVVRAEGKVLLSNVITPCHSLTQGMEIRLSICVNAGMQEIHLHQQTPLHEIGHLCRVATGFGADEQGGE